jgi:hypothetical protein
MTPSVEVRKVRVVYYELALSVDPVCTYEVSKFDVIGGYIEDGDLGVCEEGTVEALPLIEHLRRSDVALVVPRL